jgi:cell wall-associated NlpC family hydrolase
MTIENHITETFGASRTPRTRRRLAVLAMVTVGVGAFTAPVADAAPAAPASSAHLTAPSQVESRARVADPIADLALVALGALDRYVETGSADQLASYERQRDIIADAVAGRLGIDAGRLRAAWAVADTDHQQALMGGLTQLGVPYRRNTSKPGVSFDCSGFTTYAWSQAGFTLARQSTAQIRAAAPRTKDTAQAGDIVQYPGHVMMWLGVDNTIVHAVGSGRTVELDTTNHRSLKWGDPTG